MKTLDEIMKSKFTLEMKGISSYFLYSELIKIFTAHPDLIYQCEFVSRLLTKLFEYNQDLISQNKRSTNFNVLTEIITHTEKLHPDNVMDFLERYGSMEIKKDE